VTRSVKVVKEKDIIRAYINVVFKKLTPTIERIFVMTLIVCHVTACLWYFLTKMDFSQDTWIVRTGNMDASFIEVNPNISNQK
jgi:hypothetical protein